MHLRAATVIVVLAPFANGCSLLAPSDEDIFGQFEPPGDTCAEGANQSCIVRLVAGANHTCAVKSDGTLWCWGDNGSGQLGRPPSEAPTLVVPERVPDLDGVRGATAGHAQTCAWTNNGAISCWGNDEQEGKHLENTPPLSGVVSASTSYHACAIVEAGRVACWTAIGGPSDPVKRLEGIDEVAAAPAMTCARRGREPVWCWGGDFGVDPPGPEGPAAWKDLSDVAALSFGLDGPTCALRADHTVACFTKPALEPVAGLDDAVAVAVGGSHLCVRRSDCSAWCRGDNTYGQLGIGSMGASASLQRVADLAGVVELAAGTDHTCARTQDGALWCWGRRSHGQLGEGEEMSGGQFKPVPVDMSSMCP